MKGIPKVNNKDESVSEEFKMAVDRICKDFEPENIESNALWQLVTEICNQEENDDD